MRIKNHIAYRFLTDDELAVEMVLTTYPEFDGSDEHPLYSKVMSLTTLLRKRDQRAYYITNTVIDKLSMLKIKRKESGFYDWTVFKELRDMKVTFIFPDGDLLRMEVQDKMLCFAHLHVNKMYDAKNGELKWVLFYCNRITGELSENFAEQDVQKLDEFVYHLLCFMYLSDNDELELKAGQKFGTRKQGKVINELPIPLTIVNSRWNTTTIMKEKFGVRGHFAIRWTGQGRATARMVFIEPFEKGGYTRKAQSLNN